MQSSPLNDWFRARGAELREYRGSLTAWAGGPCAGEPCAGGEEATAASDASWRAALTVEGPDARKWLNGMISANVRDLEPGTSAPSFQLDPKGHILATLDVACTGPDAFVLVTDQSQVAGLHERLRKFVFISKLALTDRSEAWSAVRLRGVNAERVWQASSAPAAAVLRSSPGGVAQVEIVLPAADVLPLWEGLAAQAALAGAETVERDRILSREPRFGLDITGSELPQETGAGDRLSFTKGCYVGQEIVERIRARGAVHRHLCGLELEGEAAAGTALTGDGSEVGRLTSIAAHAGRWIGLGYLRDPHAAPGTRVRAGAVDAVVAA